MGRYFRQPTKARPCTHVVHPCSCDRDAQDRRLLPSPRSVVRELRERPLNDRQVRHSHEAQGVPE